MDVWPESTEDSHDVFLEFMWSLLQDFVHPFLDFATPLTHSQIISFLTLCPTVVEFRRSCSKTRNIFLLSSKHNLLLFLSVCAVTASLLVLFHCLLTNVQLLCKHQEPLNGGLQYRFPAVCVVPCTTSRPSAQYLCRPSSKHDWSCLAILVVGTLYFMAASFLIRKAPSQIFT